MAFAFAGTTVTFAGTNIGELVRVSSTETGNEIDVTNSVSPRHVYEAGQEDEEVSIEINGDADGVNVHDTGALVIVFNSGGTRNLGTMLVTGRDSGGGVDEAVTTTLTFKPSAA